MQTVPLLKELGVLHCPTLANVQPQSIASHSQWRAFTKQMVYREPTYSLLEKSWQHTGNYQKMRENCPRPASLLTHPMSPCSHQPLPDISLQRDIHRRVGFPETHWAGVGVIRGPPV